MVEEEREEEEVEEIIACKCAGGSGEKRASSNFAFGPRSPTPLQIRPRDPSRTRETDTTADLAPAL